MKPDEGLIVVGTFATRIAADLAQGALRAHGIDSITRSDDAGGNRPDLAARGIDVLVRPADRQDAFAILSAAEHRAEPGGSGDAR